MKIHIPEIYYPGTWLELEDRELAFEIDGMLRSLVDLVTEAAVTLSLFEEARYAPRNHKEEWERAESVNDFETPAVRI